MAGQSEAGAAMNSGRQPKSTEDVLWLVGLKVKASDHLQLFLYIFGACCSALFNHFMTMPVQVYKFERLQPLSYYAAADQPQQKSALPWGAKAGKEQALADRCRMVR